MATKLRTKPAADDEVKYVRRFSLSEDYKIEVSVYKNKEDIPILNIRRFYLHKDSDEWRPDRQGLTLRENNVPKLLAVINKIMAVASTAPPADFGPAKKTKAAPSTKKPATKSSKRKGNDDDSY